MKTLALLRLTSLTDYKHGRDCSRRPKYPGGPGSVRTALVRGKRTEIAEGGMARVRPGIGDKEMFRSSEVRLLTGPLGPHSQEMNSPQVRTGFFEVHQNQCGRDLQPDSVDFIMLYLPSQACISQQLVGKSLCRASDATGALAPDVVQIAGGSQGKESKNGAFDGEENRRFFTLPSRCYALSAKVHGP